MTSSPSSSTSSVCTSTDDARRYYFNDKRKFPRTDDAGTARLLGSYSPRGKSSGLLASLCTEKRRIFTKPVIIGTLVVVAILFAIAGYSEFRSYPIAGQDAGDLVPPDPENAPPASASKLRTFKRGAVCADGAPCAVIGRSILEKNGSAVDAALAALICNGLVNMQSLGIGGGFIMTIYDRSTQRAYVLNARDRAPLATNSTMFVGRPERDSSSGALAIAVPGELAGYWEAHRMFGRLSWRELFEPTIELCESGYVLTPVQYDGFEYNKRNIVNDPVLRGLFVDSDTGDFIKPGSVVKPRALCATLKIIAERNAAVFYNGTIGELMVEDLQKKGSVITMEDLNSYRATWDVPLKTTLSNGVQLFTSDVPGSGSLLAFILNVFDQFQFTPDSLQDFNSTILTYHRMIETYKYAYAMRTHLGDKNFVDTAELTNYLTSRVYAYAIKRKIRDDKTWSDPHHYGSDVQGSTEDHGTAHVSVLAPNGDAVSVTSTINYYFGSGVVSERTGILLNNAMDDFGIPGKVNYFGVPPSPNNFIAPGKQPLSSMVPSILVDPSGDVKIVVGASGGTKIPTAVSQALAKILWMGKTVKQAVDDPRIHHQLLPMRIDYEFGVPRQVIEGLKKLGHRTERYRERGSVVCVIMNENGTLQANADYRKGGDVYGLD